MNPVKWLIWSWSFCFPYHSGKHINATNMGKKGSWFSAIKRFFTCQSGEASCFLNFLFRKFVYIYVMMLMTTIGTVFSIMLFVQLSLSVLVANAWTWGESNLFDYEHSRLIIQVDRENNSGNERKGDGKGAPTSFIPLFRKPSTVEKIFSDFEREQQLVAIRPPAPELPSTPPYIPPPRPTSPQATSPPRAASPREPSPEISPPTVASPPRACSSTILNHHEEVSYIPTVVNHHKEVSYIPEPINTNNLSSAIKIQAAYRGYAVRFVFFVTGIV